jgi:hypothetical protein
MKMHSNCLGGRCSDDFRIAEDPEKSIRAFFPKTACSTRFAC